MNLALRISLLAAALLVAGSPLSAQTARPERPYRGLFASGVGNAGQLLTLNVSLGGGYDDNIFAEEGVGQDPLTAKAGNFGSLSGDLSYAFNTPRLNASLSMGTIARYRPKSGRADAFYASYSGVAGMSVGLWKGSRLAATHAVGYQPYFVFGLLPSVGDPGIAEPAIQGPEFGAIGDDYLSQTTGASLSQQTSRRGSLSFSYHQQISHFSGSREDFTMRGGAAAYTHGIAKGLGIRVGYGYREANPQTTVSTQGDRVHTIDAGVDFNRALSLSRRTLLSFSTGSSATSDATQTSYHITGSAQLRHEIGRTWSAALGYYRRVQFVDALAESILSDGAAFTLGGMVSRRLEFHSQASVSVGHALKIGGSGDLDTYLGSAGARYALTRHVGLGVDYSYYRYEFAKSAVLPSGFSRKMDRQSVRAHLSLWAPLVHRARRPNAAR